MSNPDFRSYLESLESQNQLLRVPQPVDTLDEMGALIARSDYAGVTKALLFENPRGFEIPVLANTIGATQERIASTFGVSEERTVPEVAEKMGRILSGGAIAPVQVDPDKAPCKEIVLKGKDADLSLLPIPRLNPGDGSQGPGFKEGRFISSLACSKPSPESHNLSYHRFEVQGPRRGPVWVFLLTNDAQGISEAWGATPDQPSSSWDKSKGKPYPMAYVLGVRPEFLLTGANPGLPYKYDDFAFVGGMMGRPVEMVRCETIDVDVPANAEIVVEGVFKPFRWGKQGRFASFNGFYDEPRRRPVFEVTAITMRRNAIYQHVHIGRPLNECNNIAAFFRSVKVFRDVQMVLPNVRDVFVDPAAGCGFTVHLSMKKNRIGEPRMAMMRAYTTLGGFAKHVFVYDQDVDIRNPHERDWALAHRFMADRDLMVIPRVTGMIIDPLAQGKVGGPARLGVYDGELEVPQNVRAFMGVDCTVPMGVEVFEEVRLNPEVESRVDPIWNALMNGQRR